MPDAPDIVIAPRTARLVLQLTLFAHLLITSLDMLRDLRGTAVELYGFLDLVGIFLVQLVHSAPAAERAPACRKALTLGGQAVLTYLPVVAWRAEWGAMAGFLSGSVLLLLPPGLGWLAFGAIGVSMVAYPLATGLGPVAALYFGGSTMLTGLVLYGLSRLVQLVAKVHAARKQLAELAVSNERVRFARDLHDLLGYSLCAITVKGELIRRIMPAQPERAQEEVSSILAISRQSLADVRAVVRGYPHLSLRQEADSVGSLLEVAGVKATVDLQLGDLPAAVDTTLATVLREGVANLLRHSEGRVCVIHGVERNGAVELCVANDGVEPGRPSTGQDGRGGLGNLVQRVSAVGGTLTAGVHHGSWFCLRVVVPLGRHRPDETAFPVTDRGLRAQSPARS
ncbi:sensor histidine kinase [Streptomyces griseorubiginosus]|uniref:sensor histidine kinase n=1 Tax=Streptomyces griseorubiginosus TaxID=67304 RepID=UPI00366A006A